MNLIPARPFSATLFHRLVFLLCCILISKLAAADYYVDYVEGADANSGDSPVAAWQHCPGDSAATAVAAGTSLAPGDTVHFKGGVTYLLSGGSGIALRWSGAVKKPITYDGNVRGTWGSGRAKFSDNYSAAAVTAFFSPTGANYLTFTNLDIGAIGGAPSLPADTGSAFAPKFGGGIAFRGAATGVAIDACAFHNLGYTFNQKPMSANSIAGTAIAFPGGNDVTITRCSFSQTAVGLDLTGAASIVDLNISDCTFSDGIVWTLVPPDGIPLTAISIRNCTELNTGQFERSAWSGYGESPRVTSNAVPAGTTVSLTASALATPTAAFQWRKNGVPLPGASDLVLTLPSVKATDAGTYSVIASNSAGASLSNELLLVVTSSGTVAPPVAARPDGNQAPAITAQPSDVTTPAFSSATFTVAASGSPAPTYQWSRNGVAIPGWTGPSLSLQGVSANDAATYQVVVSNAAGAVTSRPATLTITSPITLPVPAITQQPASVTASLASTVTFSVAATGGPQSVYQWLKNGAPVAGWTGSALTLSGISANDQGAYRVIIINASGGVASDAATLTVEARVGNRAPVITTQPASRTASALSTVTLSATADGEPAPSFQWTRDDRAIPGWTGATLTLEGVTSNDQGVYRVIATNALGSATSNGAVLTVGPLRAASVAGDDIAAGEGRLANISVRATAGSGSNALLLGFVTEGDTPKSLLIRGTGPALADFGVPGALPDPSLTLFSGASVVAANDDWRTSAGAITAVDAWLGAFALRDSNPDAALLVSLPAGVHTAQVQGKDGHEGTALMELYDADVASTARLVNVSTRVRVDGVTPPIIGFSVKGPRSRRLLVRAIGPSLAKFGIEGALADPQIEIFHESSSADRNDNWAGDAGLSAAFERIGAFPLDDAASKDAALIFTAEPGAYTIVITGGEHTTGTTLVEVYDLP